MTTSVADSEGRVPRPLGIVLTSLAMGLWGVVGLGIITKHRLYGPDCHYCVTSWDNGTAPLWIAVFSTFAASAIGLHFGKTLARTGVLIALAIYVAWSVFGESYYLWRWLADENPVYLRSVRPWLTILGWPLAWTAGLACLAGYLFGRRTRGYFQTSKGGGTS